MRNLPRGALDAWLAFDRVEPIGEEWLRTAVIAQQASFGAYCHAGVKGPELEDFMPPRYDRILTPIVLSKKGTKAAKQTFKGLVNSIAGKKKK
jgi:hypothetical protein